MSQAEEQMRLLIASNKDLFDKVEFKQETKAFLKSRLGRYLVARAEKERDDAMESLVNIDPTKTDAIRELQFTIRRAESIQYWMAEIINEGVSAEETLLAQDRANTDEADQE